MCELVSHVLGSTAEVANMNREDREALLDSLSPEALEEFM